MNKSILVTAIRCYLLLLYVSVYAFAYHTVLTVESYNCFCYQVMSSNFNTENGKRSDMFDHFPTKKMVALPALKNLNSIDRADEMKGQLAINGSTLPGDLRGFIEAIYPFLALLPCQ